MSEWYYARAGKQSGPVDFEALRDLARSGGLEKADLVWNGGMKDWTPAGQVEGIFVAAAGPVIPAGDPSDPYAAPQSAWVEPETLRDPSLSEIVPGREPIDAVACMKRGFELTTRNFGVIVLVGLVYFGVSIGAAVILGLIDAALGWAPQAPTAEAGEFGSRMAAGGSPLNGIVSNVLSIFLSLGLVRIGLNLVSGKPVEVGMLFGEGRKLLRALLASIAFGVMLVVGFLLLIVPGFYILLRYGQFMNAIVDRDLGVMDAFSYSSSITTNNRMNLFVLLLLSVAAGIAGLLAFCVGLLFAYPVIWLGWMVAFRWMQYGRRATMDHPGTTVPVLSGM